MKTTKQFQKMYTELLQRDLRRAEQFVSERWNNIYLTTFHGYDNDRKIRIFKTRLHGPDGRCLYTAVSDTNCWEYSESGGKEE